VLGVDEVRDRGLGSLERLRAAKDTAEQKRLTEELARLTFGE
jgi:hypothetical protein